MYVCMFLSENILYLWLTLLFVSANITIPIKYAQSRSTENIFKNAAHQRQSNAILSFDLILVSLFLLPVSNSLIT